MRDFLPEIRNSAMWSGDSRRIASGDACGVVLEKLGRTEIEDISDREEVAMGKRLQPIVARIFEDVHNCRLKELDVAVTHPKHDWLRSHFDYVSADNGFLVECKNYNDNYAKYFSDEGEETIRIPDADRAQCLHEAIVHGCDFVWLAVLFGGQRYRDYRLYFSPQEKEAWIRRLAEVWGNIQTGTVPPPSTPDQAREVWPQDDSHSVTASKSMEMLCQQITTWKVQKKALEENLDAAATAVMDFMGTRSSLVGLDGRVLATWKTSKASKRFNADLLKTSNPALYDSFVVDMMGSRRFLVKG